MKKVIAFLVLVAALTLPTIAVDRGAVSLNPAANAWTLVADKQALLDINTATEAQLKALPGIGDVYSKKIIAGRPYAKKDQLLSRGILPRATYDKIKDMIIAKQAKP